MKEFRVINCHRLVRYRWLWRVLFQWFILRWNGRVQFYEGFIIRGTTDTIVGSVCDLNSAWADVPAVGYERTVAWDKVGYSGWGIRFPRGDRRGEARWGDARRGDVRRCTDEDAAVLDGDVPGDSFTLCSLSSGWQDAFPLLFERRMTPGAVIHIIRCAQVPTQVLGTWLAENMFIDWNALMVTRKCEPL